MIIPRVDGLSTDPRVLGRHNLLVDCYKDNRMQGNGHYDILLGNSFLDILDKYKITREGIKIYNEDVCIFLERQNEGNYIPYYGIYNS